MERLRRSWRLFATALGVMARNPKLLLFPVVIAAGIFLVILFFLAPVVLQPTGYGYGEAGHWKAVAGSIFTGDFTRPARDGRPEIGLQPLAVVYLTVAYFVGMFVATFFNVAFYHEIFAALRGGPVSIGRGLAFAASRFAAILFWTLLAGLVGVLIQKLEEQFGFFGRWVVRLIGFAWSLASIFAIPTLVHSKERNPLAILRQSALTLRATWGESLIGFVGVQLGGGLVLLSLVLVVIVATVFSILFRNFWIVGLSIPVLIAVQAVLGYLALVGSQIYRCALYLYAAEKQLPGGFSEEMLALAWKTKR